MRCLILLLFLSAFPAAMSAQTLSEVNLPGVEAQAATQSDEAELGNRIKAPLLTDNIHVGSKAEMSIWSARSVPSEHSGPSNGPSQRPVTANHGGGFQWAAALKQSFLFLGVQHGYAMTQAKTRRELRGPFFKDYFRSVNKLGGWADGGRFFTNYISHPMEGSIAGFIQIQSDPKGLRREFGKSRGYWTSRLKSMAWNAAYSTQFEIGPISQSSIGNVGLHTSLDGKKRKMAYVDLVVTPTLGTAWLIGEDFLDRFVVRRLEMKAGGPLTRNAARVLLNPMRGAANLLRFKAPWHRDR
jgi:hypothetical protein